MPKLQLDWDGVLLETAHVDEDGVTIQTSQPGLQAILDENARMRSVNTEVRRGDQVWGHHVARIPMVVWERWCREIPGLAEGDKEAQAAMLARLNDREYAHLKTYDGVI